MTLLGFEAVDREPVPEIGDSFRYWDKAKSAWVPGTVTGLTYAGDVTFVLVHTDDGDLRLSLDEVSEPRGTGVDWQFIQR